MQITVRLLATYRQYLPEGHDAQASYPLQVSATSTVDDVLAMLPIPTGEVCTFFINGRHARRDQILRAGDVLSVFPAAGGG